jgi:hypothetical protein
MSRLARFTKTEIRRALEAAQAAGLRNPRVEISPDGALSIVGGSDERGSRTNPWDTVLR